MSTVTRTGQNGKVYTYVDEYTKPQVEAMRDKTKHKQRNCLKCGNNFLSVSFGHRLCDNCKTKNLAFEDAIC